jgi:hypothetical protein
MMKKNGFVIIVVVLFMIISVLYGKNRALNQLLNSYVDKNVTRIDTIFDLRQVNAELMRENDELVEEILVLGACCFGNNIDNNDELTVK